MQSAEKLLYSVMRTSCMGERTSQLLVEDQNSRSTSSKTEEPCQISDAYETRDEAVERLRFPVLRRRP